jgi:hypothetical protein
VGRRFSLKESGFYLCRIFYDDEMKPTCQLFQDWGEDQGIL